MPYANAEDRKAADKRHYEKYKEKIIARQMKRYHEKKEEILEKQKEYVKNNIGKVYDYRDEWRQEHKEQVNESSRKSKAKRQANDQEYRKKNAENAREWREALKLEMIQAYGGKCVICGESRTSCLTINHKNGFGDDHRRSLFGKNRGGTQFYSWLKIQGWPQDDYDLRCWNCNCMMTEEKKARCKPNNVRKHQRAKQELKEGEMT